MKPTSGRIHAAGGWGAVPPRGKDEWEDGAGVTVARSELATVALVPALPNSAALIIADAARGHRFFSAGIARLGHTAITVQDPLRAIVRLQDDALPIGAVLAPARDSWFKVREFFAFMKDAFPMVRRIAFARHGTRYADALDADLLDVALTYPVPIPRLAEALGMAWPRGER